jgi:hypothetical protein
MKRYLAFLGLAILGIVLTGCTPSVLAITRDGQKVALNSKNGLLVRTVGGDHRTEALVCDEPSEGVAFSSDGLKLAYVKPSGTGEPTSTLWVYDLKDDFSNRLGSVGSSTPSWKEDGSQILIEKPNGHGIEALDAATGDVVWGKDGVAGHTKWVPKTDSVLVAEGKALSLVSKAGTRMFPINSQIPGFMPSADGKSVDVTLVDKLEFGRPTIAVDRIDLSSGKSQRRLPQITISSLLPQWSGHKLLAVDTAFTQDGKSLVLGIVIDQSPAGVFDDILGTMRKHGITGSSSSQMSKKEKARVDKEIERLKLLPSVAIINLATHKAFFLGSFPAGSTIGGAAAFYEVAVDEHGHTIALSLRSGLQVIHLN